MDFGNKTAVITGGASGIGRATARQFAKHGAKVAILDVSEGAGNGAVSEIIHAGGTAIFLNCDVSDHPQIKDSLDHVAHVFGGIDFLFNNAAKKILGGVLELDESEWDDIMATNLKSVFLVSKLAVPFMQNRGGGVIINNSSVQAFTSSPRIAAYGASKGGVLALTRNMALDLAPYNIRVNCVCPGSIDTNMMKYVIDTLPDDQRDSCIAQWIADLPLKCLGRPEDVSEAVLFLCSGKARFITGSSLIIDGGLTSSPIGISMQYLDG
jgi:NAD(P)-dependent dehydrogenase (short-subunit alcohol dehydrogenase family)